jgi:hypothetical protein
MKTTKEIQLSYIDRDKEWYSKDEILDAIKKVQNSNKLFNDFETDFLNILFNTPDLNSRSSDEDSLNICYEVNQK